MNNTFEIHVYYDDQPDCNESPYSISRVDKDGAEICCEGSEDNLQDAWLIGCELADYYNVMCVEYATASAVATNQKTDCYDPKTYNPVS
jgi:hypothetical protein